MRSTTPALIFTLSVLAAAAAGATRGGSECVIHDWAVPPGQWTGAGDVDPSLLLMTATTRWQFEIGDCSLAIGTCDTFGSGSRSFQGGVERTEWYSTGTQPTITNPAGNTVAYDFSMRGAFVPLMGQPRLEDLDWTLVAELPATPSDSPSAAELATATSIDVTITHWVDNTLFVISWSGTATETVFSSCTQVPAELSIDDVGQAEGSGGGVTASIFTVTRSHNQQAVTVTAATADGTAVADADYTAVAPTVLTFPLGGALTQTLTVDVAAEALVELDEGFTVALSAPSNATIVDGLGAATIENDDTATLSILDVDQVEGTSQGGTIPMLFSATLDAPVDVAVAVDFDSADGTAEDESGDGDYTSVHDSLLFAAGTASNADITVEIGPDARPERDEDFFIDLSNLDAGGRAVTLTVNQGTGTLIDDDLACPGFDAYLQPFDSPATLNGHPATTGADATFESIVDGAGAVTTLAPGPIATLRAWGFGDDGAASCALDPAVPFDLVFAADAAGVPGAIVAQRPGVVANLSDAGAGVVQIDLEFAQFEAGSVSWVSVQRAEDLGCAFLWLAEPFAETYDNQVFTPPGPAPDDAYFCLARPPIFRDGFESGDTAAWTTTVP